MVRGACVHSKLSKFIMWHRRINYKNIEMVIVHTLLCIQQKSSMSLDIKGSLAIKWEWHCVSFSPIVLISCSVGHTRNYCV